VEIHALFQLLDDPDLEVYDTVAAKIIHYGKDIIPNLENLWENTVDESIQERIEQLIHRVHYQDLQEGFIQWKQSPNQDLIEGAVLCARYLFPDLSDAHVHREINRIKRNIWLELNDLLSPVEQVNVLNSMIYNYFGLVGEEVNYSKKATFFIHQVMETKKGNPITNGIIYQTLCALLDLPVFVVKIPKQFILAYVDSYFEFSMASDDPKQRVLFFIDPIQGQIYTQQDVDTYLKRIQITPDASYYTPMQPTEIIQFLLKEMAKCFRESKDHQKVEELHSLADLIA
jgi:regulator of sirC expression with transglutaminase-like and TPR domain